jgi:hypothetical protein
LERGQQSQQQQPSQHSQKLEIYQHSQLRSYEQQQQQQQQRSPILHSQPPSEIDAAVVDDATTACSISRRITPVADCTSTLKPYYLYLPPVALYILVFACCFDRLCWRAGTSGAIDKDGSSGSSGICSEAGYAAFQLTLAGVRGDDAALQTRKALRIIKAGPQGFSDAEMEEYLARMQREHLLVVGEQNLYGFAF